MSQMTDFLENKLVDFLFRGQALGITGATAAAGSGPTNLYVGLFTAAPSDTGGGTEVSGNGYARVTIASSLNTWAGTQLAGSITASSGTGGQTSNNGSISFPTPTGAGWGSVVAFGIFDAASAGNLLLYGTLSTPKAVNPSDSPSFNAAALTVTFA